METIKNYLDTMFANLPNTPEVLKAKDELWQMMEDKYTELMSEGKTENEAVGTVISEFGNLSDLAEPLGLEEIVNAKNPEFDPENKDTEEPEFTSTVINQPEPEMITADRAEQLLKDRAAGANKVSLGVAIIVLSFALLILSGLILPEFLDIIGTIIWFLTIGAGVVTIVFGAKAMESWKDINNKNFTLSMDATKYVAGEKSSYDRNHSLQLTLGILLLVISWIPSIIFSEIIPKLEDASAVMLFITAGIGIMLIVYSSMRKNGYDLLLKLNGTGTVKAAYEPENKADYKYVNSVAEFWMGVYWPTITCAYLILSFLTFKWGLTWIIWPVAGILYGPLKKALTVKKNNE